jgi:DNA-binding NarL/FixJ family response regulator
MTSNRKVSKLLIVDDSDLLQLRLKKAIGEVDESIHVVQAFTCAEAIKLFSDFVPDRVILDIALPDGSGMELLQKFKKENPKTECLMFTNYPIAEFRKICLQFGADYFIDKSDLVSLLNTLRK